MIAISRLVLWPREDFLSGISPLRYCPARAIRWRLPGMRISPSGVIIVAEEAVFAPPNVPRSMILAVFGSNATACFGCLQDRTADW